MKKQQALACVGFMLAPDIFFGISNPLVCKIFKNKKQQALACTSFMPAAGRIAKDSFLGSTELILCLLTSES